MTQRNGIEYRLAYIPAEFNVPHRKEFDQVYMRKLFDHSYRLARKGYPWAAKTPIAER